MVKRLLLTALAAAPFSVFASPYIDLGFGQSNVSETTVNGDTDDNDGFAWTVNLGYKFNNYLGLEAGYIQYAGVDINDDGRKGSDERNATDITSVLYWPNSNNYTFFAKIGAGYVTSDLSNERTFEDGKSQQTNLNLFSGVGLSYTITDSFVIDTQYNMILGDSDVGNSRLLSFGMIYFV